MPNNESVGKKIVEALKKQAETMDIQEEQMDSFSSNSDDVFTSSAPVQEEDDFFAEPVKPAKTTNFFDDIEEEKDPFFAEPKTVSSPIPEPVSEQFEMPANITVLKKLISQLPSGVSRHTGALINYGSFRNFYEECFTRCSTSSRKLKSFCKRMPSFNSRIQKTNFDS